MNASDVLESLSIETITQILTELGAEPVKETSEYIIFTSVCHGSDSHKLYLYKSSKSFHCWSHCGNMSLFDLIMRVKQCEFKDAFKYVKTFSSSGGIHGFYKPYQKKSLEDVITEPLPLINKPFLFKMYSDCAINEWLKEGISYNTTKAYDIRMDLKRNRIIIPVKDENDRVVGIRVRNLNQRDLARGIPKYQPLWYDGCCYNYPTARVFYGANIAKPYIQKFKKCIIFEGEKSPMKYYEFYNGNCIALATQGSVLSLTHKRMLIDWGCKEVILAYDKEYDDIDSDEAKLYEQKLIKNLDGLQDYMKVGYLMDRNNLLDKKDSPIDKGKKVFQKLIGERIYIN